MKFNKKHYIFSVVALLLSLTGIVALMSSSVIKAAEEGSYSLKQTKVVGDEKNEYLKLTINRVKDREIVLKSKDVSLYSEAFLDALPEDIYDHIRVEENPKNSELRIRFDKGILSGQSLEIDFEVFQTSKNETDRGTVELLVDEKVKTTANIHFESKEIIKDNSKSIEVVPAARGALAATKTYGVNPVSVGNWAEFVAALSAPAVDEINLTASLTATSSPSVNREVTINGQGQHSLNMAGYSLMTTATANMIMKDFDFLSTATVVSGLGSLTLSGKITSLPNNTGSIALMEGATIILDNADLVVDSGASTEAVFVSKFFTITNASKVKSDSQKFFGNYDERVVGSQIIVDKQSQVYTHSMKGTTGNDYGQAWDIRAQADFFVQDQGTYLYVEGNGAQRASRGGVFLMNKDNSTINVLNGAKFELHSIKTSAVVLMSQNGIFNVKDNSELKIIQDGDNNYDLGAALRFRIRGNMTFNIENNSKINIEKNSGGAAGIRMYGANNKVNIKTGSDFIVRNKGTGTPATPGYDGRNQGIDYDSASDGGSEFNLDDENSNVEIVANSGAAIDAHNYPMQIRAEKGTYFVARGVTRRATEGIFNAGILKATMTEPKYFDFRNDSVGGGLVFNNSTGSEFTTTQSDLSVWARGTNDGNPVKSWTLIDFTLAGANFPTIVSSSSQDFKNNFGSLASYSHMSANNQGAVVEELRVPTDADKFIHGYVSVPEGKHDENRPAWTGEVQLRLGVYEVNGTNETELYQVHGTINEDPIGSGMLSVYGDDARAGIFKISSKDQGFLKAGQKIKVLAAWRGEGEEASNTVHDSKPEELIAPERTVLDVTPATPTKLSNSNLNNATKVLSGTGAEAGAAVHVYYNTGDKDTGTLLGTSTVEADGSWTYNLPNYVEKTKELSIYLVDNAKQHPTAQIVSAAGVKPELYDQIGLIKPPVTNTADGNINPYNDLNYHDAVFPGVVKYKIADVLPDQPSLTKTVVSSGGATTTVGDTLTYTITASNNKGDGFETNWKDVEITDVIPDELMFDPANHGITVNGIPLTDTSKFGYSPESKTLWIKVGDLLSGTGKTPKSVKVTFNAKVGVSAVGKKIYNTAKAAGTTPREQPFVPGINPNPTYEVQDITVKDNGTHTILGALLLKSAPESIDFGKFASSKNNNEIRIDEPKVNGGDLVISDTRNPTKEWELYVRMKEPFKNTDAPTDPAYNLPDAIVYKKGKIETPITGTSTQVLSNNNSDQGQVEYNVSAGWTKEGDGIKLRLPAGSVNKLGKYHGVLEFKIQDAP